MALTPVTTETIIARNYAGLFGLVLSSSRMAAEVAKAGSTPESIDAYLNTLYLNSVGTASIADIADAMVKNTGIADPETAADAKDYIVWVLETNVGYNGGDQFLGAAINGILAELSGLGDHEEYGAIADAWNAGVAAAEAYAADPANTSNGEFNLSDTTAPVATAPDAVSYDENQAADAVLATVSATDNVGVTGFEITSGNDDGLFAISATGEITLTEAGLASAANDYETGANTFTLGVVATDAAGNASEVVDVVFNVADVDDTAPQLLAATAAPSSTTVRLNFDEALKAAVLSNPAATFTVTQGATSYTVNTATISGSSVILTLATALAATGDVLVSYTGTVLEDAAGNQVEAIAAFTASSDVTAPTLVLSTPADNATAFVAGDNLTLTFSEDVVLGTGNITIVNAADATDTRTIAANDASQVSVAGAVVTINPTADLQAGVAYYVNVAATAVFDAVGNAFAGISGATALNFSTVAVAVEGQTFTLTNSVDNVVGTSGNDTIVAGTQSDLATLNAGDQINGGAGIDTLKIFNSATVENGVNFTIASVSGVENIEFTSAATTQALDVSGNADVTKVTVVNGLDAVVTAKLTQTVGLKGNINTDAAATSFVFTSVAGAADTANLTLDGAKTDIGASDKGLSLQDVETLNLALTGTNVVGSFDSDATKLVISGAGTLKTTLTQAGSNSLVKTIDAATATGALDIDNSSFVGAVETITLGSGNDRYVTLFANMDALDKIDLGAGTNDILAFADVTDLSTATKALVISGAKNYEAIEVTGSGAMTVDGDVLTGIKSFIADTTGTLTATNIYSGTKVTVGDVILDVSTVGMKLDEKILDIVLAGTKDAISDASAGITVTGATNINVTSNGFADVVENELALTSDDNTTVKISGAKDVILTATAATGTTGFTIDGSAATGKLTLTGTAAVDNIKGGSGNDTFNKSVGVDTFTGNGGADKFVIITASGSDADTLVGDIAVTAIVTDFKTGSDTLSGFGTAASAANYVEATAAAATLTAFKSTADTALDGTVKYYVGQVGSDVYVAVDNNGIGFTDLIKLTGVSLDGIALTDIVA